MFIARRRKTNHRNRQADRYAEWPGIEEVQRASPSKRRRYGGVCKGVGIERIRCFACWGPGTFM